MPMMKCGCASQGTCSKLADGTVFDPPVPCCITHTCIEVADEGDSLKLRTARCTYYGQAPRNNECDKCRLSSVCRCEQVSSPDLAFFVFQGPGSPYAEEHCVCGYHKIAHDKNGGKCPEKSLSGKKPASKQFTERGPAEHDRFYCGCKSWD